MKSWFMDGSHAKDYESGLDADITYQGKKVAYLKSIVESSEGFGTLMQMFKADNYLSKRMRLSAAVKSSDIEGWAGLWMRIDGAERKLLGFDNMQNRSIKGTTDWQTYEVVLDVPAESVDIAFGVLLDGKGQAWLSNFQFEEVSIDIPTTSLESSKAYPEKPGNLDFTEGETE